MRGVLCTYLLHEVTKSEQVHELTFQVVEQGRELSSAGRGQDEGQLSCHISHLEGAGTWGAGGAKTLPHRPDSPHLNQVR